MNIIITERQSLILENKNKYEHGFDLLKKIVLKKYPFITKIEYKGNHISEKYYYLIMLDVTIDREKYNEYHGYDFFRTNAAISSIEDLIGHIYDILPKNVRYNYPDDHEKWPGEASGVRIDNIKTV